MLTATSSCGSLAISSSQRLERAGDVGLDDQVELLELARLGALEDVLERDLAARAARERLGLQAAGALARRAARLALVLDDARRARRPRARRRSRAPRPARRGAASFMRCPCSRASRGRGPSAAPATSASPTSQRAALDEDRDDGAAARVELGLDDDAGRLGVRVGLAAPRARRRPEIVSSSVVEADLASWPTRRRTRCRRPTRPAAGPAGSSRVRTRVGSAPSLSILLTATMIGTSAALAWSIASWSAASRRRRRPRRSPRCP